MSTHHFLRCLDHEPPLESDVVAQHCRDYDIEPIIALIHLRDKLDALPFTGDYHIDNARRFLHAHPKCNLDLWTEYGVVERVWDRDNKELDPCGP